MLEAKQDQFQQVRGLMTTRYRYHEMILYKKHQITYIYIDYIDSIYIEAS